MLCEVVYISAARVPFTPAALEVLLHKARVKNAAWGITGMLIHLEGSFLQVLEGPDAAVTSLFETIGRDVRHGGVLQLFRSSKKERSFGEWTMGYVDTSARTSSVPGFNDFFRRGFAHTGLDPSAATKARELALQFRHGRWRQDVNTG